MCVEVPILYRASQYDHTSDSYIPKKLSQRMYHLDRWDKGSKRLVFLLLTVLYQ
ncbi:MAG: hypothetical protein ACLTRS_12855 [Lachnospiraceae bacterium]